MRYVIPALTASVVSTPALAATGPFFSLGNTDFVVLIAFIIFIAVLLYFKVPTTLLGMLDKRAEGIKSDLEEARTLREEAQKLLASYERKQQDVQEQADRIVASAKEEAEASSEKAKEDLEKSIQRRIKAAEDQIELAQSEAIRDVRNRAIKVAVAAAADVLAKDMDEARANALIDESIKTVEAKLH